MEPRTISVTINVDNRLVRRILALSSLLVAIALPFYAVGAIDFSESSWPADGDPIRVSDVFRPIQDLADRANAVDRVMSVHETGDSTARLQISGAASPFDVETALLTVDGSADGDASIGFATDGLEHSLIRGSRPSGNEGWLRFYTKDTGSNLEEAMTIDNKGNVLIEGELRATLWHSEEFSISSEGNGSIDMYRLPNGLCFLTHVAQKAGSEGDCRVVANEGYWELHNGGGWTCRAYCFGKPAD